MSGQETVQLPQTGQPTIQVLLHTGNAPPSTTTEQPSQDGKEASSLAGGQFKPLAEVYTTNQAPATPEQQQLPSRENGTGKSNYSMLKESSEYDYQYQSSLDTGLSKVPPPPHTPTSALNSEATAIVEGSLPSGQEVRATVHEVDVRSSFSGLPKVKPHWVHRYMKILIVGENGLGRTTFVRNLFSSYANDPNFAVNDASDDAARKVFERSPERLCTEIVLGDPDQRVYWHWNIQDTPGYGDSTELEADRQVILDYITGCSDRHLEQERDPSRRDPIHNLPDSRVDACLYFLPPHRLRKMDVAFMRALAPLVPVIPILAKADTMTSEELKEFRHRVRTAVDHHRDSTMWHFSREALEDAGARHGPPFAVISSQDMDLSIGRFWPVRKYPWGACEAMLSAHSDLPALRKVLFETGYWELKEATEARYHRFRAERRDGVERGEGGGGEGRRERPPSFRRMVFKLGSIALGVYLVRRALPAVRDDIYHSETLRRVKHTVNEVVDAVVEGVEDAKGSAEDAGHTVRKVAHGAAHGASRALESEEARKRRLENEARKNHKGRWWGFGGR